MLNLIFLAGVVLLLGFFIGKGTHLMKITGVIGYIITGIILGPEVLGILKLDSYEIEMITNIALGFVAFVIGGELTLALLKKTGKSIIAIIIGESFGAFIVVFLGIYLLTNDLVMAIIFASIAPASAPAGTVAVLHEYKAKGNLTNAILAVVGFDDGLAVLIYAFSIAIVGVLLSGVLSISTMVFEPIRDIGGAILIGAGIGLVFGVIFKRLIEREEIIVLSLTAIFLTAGLSIIYDVSLILSCMTLGMVIMNLFPQDNKPVFEHTKSISLPVYILFFVIAGISLHFSALLSIGLIGIIYILCRSIGLIGGGYLSAFASKADPVIRNNIGFGILSQAGVAIGLSLVTYHKLVDLSLKLSNPDLASLATDVVTIVAASTVVFAVIGPLLARYAILRSGEAQLK